ncbi:ATPase P [Pedobacter psychrophilus]|uniref:ATPase P n=1 Tax=Pedobacter psychrophilus TaxID=1826909 RepID=A0A179DN33_9SPHI|nr:heavy metal translocating P-type ATPase [Pedobacter psychrophilus]OAQ42288.1 ATPase P [Pedobacter psychrophilus]
MKHTYKISGMSCNGCSTNAENALNTIDGIKVTVTLNPPEAIVETEKPISIEKLQEALSAKTHYTIADIDKEKSSCCGNDSNNKVEIQPQNNNINTSLKQGNGIFYCPMHCEGDKTYNKSGDCPVCGMDLVEEASTKKATQYTCPMHPEIVANEPGSCPICGMDLVPMESAEEEEDKTYLNLLRKFKIAAAFTIPIFLIAMSDMIPNNPMYKLMDLKYWNWVEFAFSIPVIFYATWMFFERAWRSVITWNLNMFTLIGIGSGVAWLFSVVALIFPNVFPDQFKTEAGTVYVYFEAATVILTLVLMGQLLEARAHGKTNSAIKELLKLAPNKATKIVDGQEKVVAIDSIHPGDLLRVKPGEKIPVDGSIHEGEAIINESMISGEPVPVQKMMSDKVSSGTINGNKSFVMITEKVGSETLLSQIIEMVNSASRSKAPIQKMADKISGFFVPIVVFISVITFIVWAIYGPQPPYVFAFVNAIAVLIIACPCALGLATPMSVMVGVGKGAQSGVLIKNAESLEKMDKMEVLIIDKTGTMTEGKPSVEHVESLDPDFSEADILEKIISLNSFSEHPLAQATLNYGKDQNIKAQQIAKFEAITGKGVIGELKGENLALGNDKLMADAKANITKEINERVTNIQKQGKTVSYLALENKVIGFVVISDKIKISSKEAIQRLQKEGLKVFMFTGDNEETAKAVSESLNLDGYKAQMLPQDKLEEIKKLQASGKKVAMAGDGINDAPALSQADIGIAMGTGTDVAIQSAGITLVKGDLNGIFKAKQLSHKVMKNIKQNLFFALGYNVIGIPIAAGILYPFFGMLLSPMIAALAMSFSSVSVIINALRLKTTNIK